MKHYFPTLLIATLISTLCPINASSQVSLPFTLGKEYLRSEITAVVGAAKEYTYDFGGGEDDLTIQLHAKGVIINQYYSDLDLEWVMPDEHSMAPVVNYQSTKFTKRRAPLIGIALTDPTYRILEDLVPGGLYVGMPRTALGAIKGSHSDGSHGGIPSYNYRIILDEDTMLLMRYNAWDRVTFIEYMNDRSGIFSWPEDDLYAPIDEKDTLVTSFHDADDIRGILMPSDPADAFALFSDYNLIENTTDYSGSKSVSFASLLDFDDQWTEIDNENFYTWLNTPFRQDGWRGFKAVIHDKKDDIDWNRATAIRWSYLQTSNRAVLEESIVTRITKSGFGLNQTNFSRLPITRPTEIAIYTDLQGNIKEIRVYYGGRIFYGRLLKRGEMPQSGEKARFLTVYTEAPRARLLGIDRGYGMEIIGTYCIAEQMN
jgi:hypothetical protein